MLMESVKDEYSVVEGIDLSQLKPMPKHLLVRWLGKTETKGGVILPQNRQRVGLMKGVLLKVGSGCDARLSEGLTVEFDGLCEKEFLGAQIPGDRDPVFFMREEDLIGIVWGPGNLEMLNKRILSLPDKDAAEKYGLVVLSLEQKGQMVSGVVVSKDAKDDCDFNVGDRVFYDRGTATELKLGDFDGELHHITRSAYVEAVEPKEEQAHE